jgi:hypothetical protein
MVQKLSGIMALKSLGKRVEEPDDGGGGLRGDINHKISCFGRVLLGS